MDLFQYASVANQFTSELWICLLVGGLCFLIIYIFQGMGLYTISKHEGYGSRWMAWVPFLQIYYIGVCSQKNKVLGTINTKSFSIAVALLDFLLFAGYALYYVSYFLVEEHIHWSTYYYGEIPMYEYIDGFYTTLPSNLTWAAWIVSYLKGYVLEWVRLLFIIGKLFLYTAFYRTYSARRYFLFSIVGALLPVNGIIIYCVRNNKGLNYNEYIRKVREENYRRYQQQMQQQQNPYNQNPYSRGYGAPPPNDPYNNNGPYNNGQQGSSAPDPFEEYANSSGNNSNGNSNGNSSGSSADDSPFDEFN